MKALYLILLLCFVTSSWAQSCPFAQGSPTGEILNYLGEHSSAEEDPCIDFALQHIKGRDLTEHQIAAVTRFLDHMRSLSEGEKQGFAIRGPAKAYLYPAVDTLFSFGFRSREPLIEVLGTPQSEVVRSNALRTWGLIHRDDPTEGVRQLVRASANSPSRERSSKLKRAAQLLADACDPRVRTTCHEELKVK